jgi:hypothetical protein
MTPVVFRRERGYEGELNGLPVTMKADENGTNARTHRCKSAGDAYGKTKAEINFEEANLKAVTILGIHAAYHTRRSKA